MFYYKVRNFKEPVYDTLSNPKFKVHVYDVKLKCMSLIYCYKALKYQLFFESSNFWHVTIYLCIAINSHKFVNHCFLFLWISLVSVKFSRPLYFWLVVVTNIYLFIVTGNNYNTARCYQVMWCRCCFFFSVYYFLLVTDYWMQSSSLV